MGRRDTREEGGRLEETQGQKEWRDVWVLGEVEEEKILGQKEREGGRGTGRGGRMQETRRCGRRRREVERKDVETQRKMDGGRRDGR